MVTEPSGERVRAELSFPSTDPGVTFDLYQWLRDDPGVRAHAEVGLARRPGADTAMGALDVISLVLSQGIAGANLAIAYAAWRSARPTAPPLTVEVDGRQIIVRGGSEADIAELMRSLTAANEDDSTEATRVDPGRVREEPEQS
ncbi:effector-associated constant component EACC1 [Nocardia brasiliensis]|uniref:effector-associated constant component EACC1 n=1 Tax=Nocardia brasiliensis TaxID=37326 RepID=UPI0024553155|nr:hypothetical protein [Nocardia brasiliensis]